MAASAYVVHKLPGRTRLRIPARRGDNAFFADVAHRLERSDHVDRVDANALTGSLLVHHDGTIDDLAGILLGSDLRDLLSLVLTFPPVAHRLRAEVAVLDERVRRSSGGALDLGTVASLGLFALAALHLVRGRQRIGAVSLAWYAAELLRRDGSASPETREIRKGA